ncbi:MAG: hypothetical protein HN509_01935 [Halobacteriovoraceae bacterium]|nr:hypothetical protein [Halobacteriovoraceae bacterium]MBT5095129.1 hypothetical protein [Halobacteriovoraceae bacterium]
MNEKTQTAAELLNKVGYGILSTHSLDCPGYPFGSLTPYALDGKNYPILLVSDLAQHTKNMIEDPKVSLTIAEESDDDKKQTLGRLTYLGTAQKIEESDADFKEVSNIYLSRFPESKSYFEAHNFFFYRLNFFRGRLIEGFGKICWIEKEDWSD